MFAHEKKTFQDEVDKQKKEIQELRQAYNQANLTVYEQNIVIFQLSSKEKKKSSFLSFLGKLFARKATKPNKQQNNGTKQLDGRKTTSGQQNDEGFFRKYFSQTFRNQV